ncbi:MAG: FGGY-family carbohydrate kinase [Bacilli bacterium]|nr:FGGY-family carbohydrate kinase [Bacilli bacterium]
MDNNDKLVLTLDFGTQSVRSALVNKKGDIVAIVKKPYIPLYRTPEKGYVEQDADFYLENAKEALKKLCSENKDLLPNIVGSTITTFRDTSVQLDKDLKPIRPCILWLDQRLAKACEKLPLIYKILFKIVGMKDTIVLNRRRTVAHWLKENERDTWNKTYKYVNISTYLIYKFTGNLVDSAANMCGHYPINYKKKVWYAEKAMKGIIFGIPKRMLCELKQPGEELGIITDEVADELGLPHGIKLIGTGSDKGNETIGLGALNNETAAVSYGTACSIEVSNQKYHEPEPFLPAYAASVPGWYNMEVQVYRGYWMLTWFYKEFANDLFDAAKIQNIAVEELLNKSLGLIPPGSDGLIVQPYWGPGLRRPLAKGGIIGFSDIHTRNHLYRAIIEGIAYALREGLIGIEKSQHHKVKEIKISGGGSMSEAICQITADIFGLPVSRVQTFETTTLGAAISTFVALKEFNDVNEACENMSHVGMTFYPNEAAHQEYEKLFKIYLKMYPNLKGTYKAINTFNKR